jgi:hypothetical protein
MVEDIDRAVEAVGKLSKAVVHAAAANSNNGLLIGIWPGLDPDLPGLLSRSSTQAAP